MKIAPSVVAYVVMIATPAVPLHATLVQVSFTASVTHVQNTPVFGMTPSLGDVVTGSFFYDKGAPDLYPFNPSLGYYSSGGATFSLNGHTITSNGPSAQVVHDINAPNDIFVFVHGVPQQTSHFFVDGVPYYDGWFSFNLDEPSGGLPSDSLPSVSEFASLVVSQFNLVEQSTNGVILFDLVTSLTVTAIPEPSPVLGFALVGISIASVFLDPRRRLPRSDYA